MNIDYFFRKQTILLSKTSSKYIRDKYFRVLKSNERLIGLVGARGVGKTTVILQYLQSLSEQFIYEKYDLSRRLVLKRMDTLSFKEYLKYGAYPFYLEGLDSFD
jgi:predicted AAA+ superfamily ATPase